MPVAPRPVIDRLMEKLSEDANGCWIYGGSLARSGYGAIGLGGRSDGVGLTHRVTYEYFIATIPEGLHIDHLCRNRACCNPWHLEAVSQAENNRRAWVANGPTTHCKRGHEFTPENTAQTPLGRRACRACRHIRDTRKRNAA